MSLYSDDRRKRKWDNPETSSSPHKSSRADRDSDRDRDRDRDRERDRYESRHDDRHGSSSSSHRDRDSRHGSSTGEKRRSASPQSAPREPRKPGSSRDNKPPMDPAAAAAAAAARISANLGNRLAIPPTIPQNYGQTPLPGSTPSDRPLAITNGPPPPPPPSHPVPPPPQGGIPAPPPPTIGVIVKKDERGPLGDVYQQDGDWMKDIEINNLRNRYLLTKSTTQQQIKRDTGADVTTRGKYYPDTALATERDPPLYLHITATTYPALERASRMVQELIDREMGSLVDERRFRRTDERDEFGRRKWPEEKIPIGMESVRGFNVRAQIVGPGGSYVKHISTETRTRVQIKGQNSGFMEPSTGRESDEPTYLHITGPDEVEVFRAKELAVDLINTVREAYEAHISGVPPASSVQPSQPPQQLIPQPQQMSPPGVPPPPPGTAPPFTFAPGSAYPAYQPPQYYGGGGSSGYGGAPGMGGAVSPPPPPPPGVGNGYGGGGRVPANVVSPPPPPPPGMGYGQYSAMPPPPGV